MSPIMSRLWLPWLATMTTRTVVHVDASSVFVPLRLGPDYEASFSDADLLRGFKLNTEDGENPLKAHVFESDSMAIPFTSSYTKSSVVTSADEAVDSLEISGSLSVSYGPMISGSGAGRFFRNKADTRNEVSIIYRTRRVAYARSVQISNLTLTKQAREVEGADARADLFGTRFVDQIVYGAQLDIRYTVSSEEEIDVQEIEAELQGKIGVGPLKVGFQAKFEQRNGSSRSQYSLSIVAEASGINVNVPANPTFDNTTTIIQQFNDDYEALLNEAKNQTEVDGASNVLKRLTPVGFTLSAISDFDEVNFLGPDLVAVLDRKLDQLSTVFFEALYWGAVLDKAKARAADQYGLDPRIREEVLTPYESEVLRQQGELDRKITDCLAFRGKPVRDILSGAVPVPDLYPRGETVNLLHGLAGEGYIPSPLFGEFQNLHYVGYTLRNATGDLQAWMRGSARRNEDNRVFAVADTPEELRSKVLGILDEPLDKTVHYGDDWTITELECDQRRNSIDTPLDDVEFVGPVRLVFKTSLDFAGLSYRVELHRRNEALWKSPELLTDFVPYYVSEEIGGNTNETPPKAGYFVQFVCTTANASCTTSDGEPLACNCTTSERENLVCDGRSFQWNLIDCGCPDHIPEVEQNCIFDSVESARGAVCYSSPSASPSSLPSSSPSDAPSDSPSRQPSTGPSSAPSAWPTETSIPSLTPTLTNKPSDIPTDMPTSRPSQTPTLSPSLPPTQSNAPSVSHSPSEKPAISPLGAPSSAPGKTTCVPWALYVFSFFASWLLR